MGGKPRTVPSKVWLKYAQRFQRKRYLSQCWQRDGRHVMTKAYMVITPETLKICWIIQAFRNIFFIWLGRLLCFMNSFTFCIFGGLLLLPLLWELWFVIEGCNGTCRKLISTLIYGGWLSHGQSCHIFYFNIIVHIEPRCYVVWLHAI